MMLAIELALSIFLITAAVLVVLLRDIIASIATFAALSLGLAIVWMVLGAPDVALTEAAVGAGVMTVLLLIVAGKSQNHRVESPHEAQRPFRKVNWIALSAVTLLLIPLIVIVRQFPPLGDANAPSVVDISLAGNPTPYWYYVGGSETPATYENIVGAVLIVFRGLDTFGELIVAFAALIGVLIILRHQLVPFHSQSGLDEATRHRTNYHDKPQPGFSPVVTTAVRRVIPLVLVFGGYITLYGTAVPGGGFAGGVVLGAGFILLGFSFGFEALSRWIDHRVLGMVLLVGAALFVGIIVGPLLLSGTLFEISIIPLDPRVVGEAVELGIGLLVGSVITAIVTGMAIFSSTEANLEDSNTTREDA